MPPSISLTSNEFKQRAENRWLDCCFAVSVPSKFQQKSSGFHVEHPEFIISRQAARALCPFAHRISARGQRSHLHFQLVVPSRKCGNHVLRLDRSQRGTNYGRFGQPIFEGFEV